MIRYLRNITTRLAPRSEVHLSNPIQQTSTKPITADYQ